MSIIIEIEEDEVFRLYHYYHKACFPHWKEGDIHEVESIEERRKCWGCHEWIEAEQEMQALDGQIGSQDCSFCPPESQYPIAEGYSVKGVPSCKYCAIAAEMEMIESAAWKAYLSGELDPRKVEF